MLVPRKTNRLRSFANTESRKECIEQIVGVDLPGEAPEGFGRRARPVGRENKVWKTLRRTRKRRTRGTEQLAATGCGVRVRYIMNEGYKLVDHDE